MYKMAIAVKNLHAVNLVHGNVSLESFEFKRDKKDKKMMLPLLSNLKNV